MQPRLFDPGAEVFEEGNYNEGKNMSPEMKEEEGQVARAWMTARSRARRGRSMARISGGLDDGNFFLRLTRQQRW